MSVIAEAEIHSPHASGYLVEICRQLDEKAQTKPWLGVRLKWTDTDATVDFGWGRCTMHAGLNTLSLRAESVDDDGLSQVRELITRHLEKQVGDHEVTITWRQGGAAIVDTHTERRDTMRGLHRRMRH